MTLRERLAKPDAKSWIEKLAIYIGLASKDIDEITVFPHYFTITYFKYDMRLEVFEHGYIELYGSNAGVNAAKLMQYMKDIDWVDSITD